MTISGAYSDTGWAVFATKPGLRSELVACVIDRGTTAIPDRDANHQACRAVYDVFMKSLGEQRGPLVYQPALVTLLIGV